VTKWPEKSSGGIAKANRTSSFNSGSVASFIHEHSSGTSDLFGGSISFGVLRILDAGDNHQTKHAVNLKSGYLFWVDGESLEAHGAACLQS
jgi:hypothetical protein